MKHPNEPDADAEQSARINGWLRQRMLSKQVAAAGADDFNAAMRRAAGMTDPTTEETEDD